MVVSKGFNIWGANILKTKKEQGNYRHTKDVSKKHPEHLYSSALKTP